MTLLAINPILETEQLDSTQDFYTQVLGFKCESRAPGWLSLVLDQVRIMFCEPNGHKKFVQPELTGSLYLYSDNPDAAWENLQNKVDVCYPIETFDYGMREFGFYDINGYLLKIGQPVG